MYLFRAFLRNFLIIFLQTSCTHSAENGTTLFPCSELNTMEPINGTTDPQQRDSNFSLQISGHGEEQACFDPFNWTKGKGSRVNGIIISQHSPKFQVFYGSTFIKVSTNAAAQDSIHFYGISISFLFRPQH